MLTLASEWAKVVRVVILKINGEFERGFNVSLQMGFEGQSFDVEVSGKLPQAPQLLKYLEAWQTQYRQLDFSKRIKPVNVKSMVNGQWSMLNSKSFYLGILV